MPVARSTFMSLRSTISAGTAPVFEPAREVADLVLGEIRVEHHLVARHEVVVLPDLRVRLRGRGVARAGGGGSRCGRRRGRGSRRSGCGRRRRLLGRGIGARLLLDGRLGFLLGVLRLLLQRAEALGGRGARCRQDRRQHECGAQHARSQHNPSVLVGILRCHVGRIKGSEPLKPGFQGL